MDLQETMVFAQVWGFSPMFSVRFHFRQHWEVFAPKSAGLASMPLDIWSGGMEVAVWQCQLYHKIRPHQTPHWYTIGMSILCWSRAMVWVPQFLECPFEKIWGAAMKFDTAQDIVSGYCSFGRWLLDPSSTYCNANMSMDEVHFFQQCLIELFGKFGIWTRADNFH